MIAMDATEEILLIALVEKKSAVEAQAIVVQAMKSADASRPKIDTMIESVNDLKLKKTSIER
jgi:hypothetical protein